jgi:transposase
MPVTVPAVHACALIKTDIAKSLQFDTGYTGCAWREETDFFIRATLAGYKLMYQPLATQINLPLSISGNTGAHSGGHKQWVESVIECNKYFLEKNWEALREKYGFSMTWEQMQRNFIKICQRKTTRLWRILKKVYFKLFFIFSMTV